MDDQELDDMEKQWHLWESIYTTLKLQFSKLEEKRQIISDKMASIRQDFDQLSQRYCRMVKQDEDD